MSITYTIARRELTSLFFSPIAYLVLAVSALGTTWFFTNSYGPGMPATLRGTFGGYVWLMIFLIPAISMRLVSEEFRSGTIEPLLTAPVTDAQVILGKWLGAMGFLVALMLPILVLAGVLEATAAPDYGPIATGLLGMLLVGGLYMAIGTFASAFTQNQIIAFVLTMMGILTLTLAMYLLALVPWLWPRARETVQFLNVATEFEDFNKGLIDTSKVIFFVSGIGLFLFLAVKVLESRRWR